MTRPSELSCVRGTGGLWRPSRRGVLAAFGALACHAVGVDAQGGDDPADADLESASLGRMVRVGSPATGTVSTLPLEVYVARVLAAESDPRSHDAARLALAVAIRTYALVNEGRHAREGYDVCDNTHCQVVRGATSATRRLTELTSRQILTFEGRPAPLFYSASCGGYSERASDVWPGVSYPYLQVRADEVHEDDPPWTLELPMAEAEAALRRQGFTGSLVGVQVEGRTSSGRVAALRLDGMSPAVVDGNQFRLAVSATRVRSTAFALTADDQMLYFAGRGYGHGVGMCVVGAGTRALRGESAEAILARYYPGLELVQLGASGRPGTEPRPQPFPSPR